MRCEWEEDLSHHGTGWTLSAQVRCLMQAEPGRRFCAYHAAREADIVENLRRAIGRTDGPCLPKNIKILGEES